MDWPTDIVVDVETTSKYPERARVIQLGTSVREADGTVRTGAGWVNPGMPVPADVVEAIGLTGEELEAIRKAPLFRDLRRPTPAEMITGMARRAVVIGYNILRYDQVVLSRELKMCGLEWPSVAVLDVMVMAQHLLVDEGLSDYRLTTVAGYFGLTASGAHRADADCQMTRGVLERLVPCLPDDLEGVLQWQADRVPLGNFWALRPDGTLALNCLSKKNPRLKRGMTQEEVYGLDQGFYGWTFETLGQWAQHHMLMPF